MANSAQARKRARQAEVHRQRNASQRSAMRTTIKALRKAIAAG
ncbi:30S ribosomal protein S20, partial [Methylophaga sp. UBA5088]